MWFSAVKFIRDQAEAITSTEPAAGRGGVKSPVNTAQAAATVIKRILTRDRGGVSIDVADDLGDEGPVDPLVGWDEGVALQKRHFCLLLKPQIVLRSEGNPDSVSVLAAVQAKLQSFTILDKSNLEDPISGTIMTRYTPNFDQLCRKAHMIQKLHVLGWASDVLSRRPGILWRRMRATGSPH